MKPNGRLYVKAVQIIASFMNHSIKRSEAFTMFETKIEELKLKTKELNESKEQLEHRNRKLAEESSYAKSLASAAAVELKALSEEVAKLMNHNRKLSAELSTHNSPIPPSVATKQEQRRKGESCKEKRARQLVNDGAEERTKNEQRP
ncbi:unnamed protein product [Brassica oleracea]|uniref:Uncharacterized protein n=1 Tax=Brassica oleracea TaxID=3712 RepID=A0A3P6G8T6_BRAOL|nr:unnamed protein product [Brassica oleracea]